MIIVLFCSMMTTTGTGPCSMCPSTAWRRRCRWCCPKGRGCSILVNGENIKAMIHHILFLPCIAVGYTTRNPTVTQEPSVKRSRKLLNLPNLHFFLRGIKLDYQSQQSKLLCSQVICGKICFEKETEDKEGKWWVGRY